MTKQHVFAILFAMLTGLIIGSGLATIVNDNTVARPIEISTHSLKLHKTITEQGIQGNKVLYVKSVIKNNSPRAYILNLKDHIVVHTSTHNYYPTQDNYVRIPPDRLKHRFITKVNLPRPIQEEDVTVSYRNVPIF